MSFLSTHYHLLVIPDSEKQLADFMRFVNTNLSKQLGRLHGWSGPMWRRSLQGDPGGRPHEEGPDRAARSTCWRTGVKEDLVQRPRGLARSAGCVEVLRTRLSRTCTVIWLERTKIWEAKQRGIELSRGERITRETLKLSRLPEWEHMTRRQYRDAIRELVAEIEREHRDRREAEGKPVLGARRFWSRIRCTGRSGRSAPRHRWCMPRAERPARMRSRSTENSWRSTGRRRRSSVVAAWRDSRPGASRRGGPTSRAMVPSQLPQPAGSRNARMSGHP